MSKNVIYMPHKFHHHCLENEPANVKQPQFYIFILIEGNIVNNKHKVISSMWSHSKERQFKVILCTCHSSASKQYSIAQELYVYILLK